MIKYPFLGRNSGEIMKNKILICFLFLFAMVTSCCRAEATTIKVGVGLNLTSGGLSSRATMSVTDRKGTKLSSKGMVFSVSGNSILVSGKTLTSPVEVRSSSPIIYDKRPYLGSFQVISAGGRLFFVNVLDVESYLRGVLKMEVNPSWPMESLKAQAIISRTYALNQIGRHAANGFDVCSTQHCQVYRGINAHDPTIDKAISATKNKVLNYHGKLAKTFFHSDSGGATAAARDVWGGDIPYLLSVSDPIPSSSPHSRWTTSLTGSQIGTALAKSVQNIGTVTSISIISRDSSGRVLDMEVIGTRGRVRIRGHKFREALGSSLVKSTNFTLRGPGGHTVLPTPSSSPSRPSIPVGAELSPEEDRILMILTKQGAFSSEELILMLTDPSKRRHFLQKAQGKVIPVPKAPTRTETSFTSSNTFNLEGKGWGHGVGLSQWGAKALASSGWTAEKILVHYYPGTSIGVGK